MGGSGGRTADIGVEESAGGIVKVHSPPPIPTIQHLTTYHILISLYTYFLFRCY